MRGKDQRRKRGSTQTVSPRPAAGPGVCVHFLARIVGPGEGCGETVGQNEIFTGEYAHDNFKRPSSFTVPSPNTPPRSRPKKKRAGGAATQTRPRNEPKCSR